jgi:hypothetical protein
MPVGREEVRQVVGRAVMVVDDEADSSSGLSAPSERRRMALARNGLALLFVALLLMRPLRTRTRVPGRIRSVALYAVASALWTVLLLTLAGLHIPALSSVAHTWARVAAVAMLGVGTAVLIALETRRFGLSRWADAAFTLARHLIPITVISASAAACVLAPVTADPETLQPFRNWGLLAWLLVILLVIPAFWWVARLVPLLRTERTRSRLRAGLQGRGEAFALEVWLGHTRSGSRSPGLMSTLPIHDPFPGPAQIDARPLVAFNVAMLHGTPMGLEAARCLRGMVINTSERDLVHAATWELDYMVEFVRTLYRSTWAPVWLTGNWIGRASPARGAMQESLCRLEPLGPLLAGYDPRPAAALDFTHALLAQEPPQAMVAALHHNQLVSSAQLLHCGIDTVLRDAFTPVAVHVRAVFGAPGLRERIHRLTQAVETALAFFALALVAEYEAGLAAGRDESRIGRGIRKNLGAPTFHSWESLIHAFRGAGTPLSSALAATLSAPVRTAPEAAGLAVILADAGERALPIPLEREHTRGEALALVRATRNRVGVHGPAVEHPEVYTALVPLVLDLLCSLPWRDAVLVTDGSGGARTHTGCLPEPRVSGAACPLVVVQVRDPEAHDEIRRVDAARWFRPLMGGNSVAVYVGTRQWTDPVSGIRVSQGLEEAA